MLAKGVSFFVVKFFVDFPAKEVYKSAQANSNSSQAYSNSNRRDSHEPTEKNHTDEVSGDCFMLTGLQYLLHICTHYFLR
jgi:hypothetical protein